MTTEVGIMEKADVLRRREARRTASATVMKLSRSTAMREAIGHFLQGRLRAAEAVVRRHLLTNPRDVAALCLLGDLAVRGGIHWEAERLFRLALRYAPAFDEAQLNLAKILALRDAVPEAIALLQEIAEDEPERTEVALMGIALLYQIGKYADGLDACEALVSRHPDNAPAWLACAHVYKTLGDADRSIQAYRRAIALDECQGEAWWGLANLKTYTFSSAEVAQMEALIVTHDRGPALSAQLHFALGKNCEDRQAYAASFHHYVAGNSARRSGLRYDPAAISAEVDRSIDYFTADRLAASVDHGHPGRDPIFIIGLPRAGSTLVEQIIASHSAVEGTAELSYIPMLVHRILAERWAERDLTFPAVLEALPSTRLKDLGQIYLDAAAIHRKSERAFFVDKLPNNWAYVGFIRLILPNAKIVDARRAAMDCGWSNFKQWFARGQEFSYALDDIGAYYRDYVRLMQHFDDVAPGWVYRVQHEALLADPETEIRRLLDFLRLPFEDACLRPHENTRPVRTASSEQVRRPINRDAVDQWRNFEPWLGELKKALGDAA